MCTEGERPYVASSYAYQVHIYPDKRGVDMRLQCVNVHRRERPYAYQMGKKLGFSMLHGSRGLQPINYPLTCTTGVV